MRYCHYACQISLHPRVATHQFDNGTMLETQAHQKDGMSWQHAAQQLPHLHTLKALEVADLLRRAYSTCTNYIEVFSVPAQAQRVPAAWASLRASLPRPLCLHTYTT